MQLYHKLRELIMTTPLNQLEQKLQETLTTEESIKDVSTHLIQLLAKHQVDAQQTSTMHEFKITFWAKKRPDGKVAIDRPAIYSTKQDKQV